MSAPIGSSVDYVGAAPGSQEFCHPLEQFSCIHSCHAAQTRLAFWHKKDRLGNLRAVYIATTHNARCHAAYVWLLSPVSASDALVSQTLPQGINRAGDTLLAVAFADRLEQVSLGVGMGRQIGGAEAD